MGNRDAQRPILETSMSVKEVFKSAQSDTAEAMFGHKSEHTILG